MINHQFDGNHQLVYVMVRKRRAILELRDMTISGTVDEEEAIKKLSEEQRKRCAGYSMQLMAHTQPL